MSEALDRVAADPNVLRIDPAEKLCGGDQWCLIRAEGKILYFDDDHLNVDGSLFLYPLLQERLDLFLATRHSLDSDGRVATQRP